MPEQSPAIPPQPPPPPPPQPDSRLVGYIEKGGKPLSGGDERTLASGAKGRNE